MTGAISAAFSIPLAAVLAVLKVGLSDSGSAMDTSPAGDPAEKENDDPY
jgi:hypothetical protein